MSAFVADLRISFMNLVEHGRRSMFLGAAIAAVTCLFVLLTALSSGIRHTLLDTATTLTTGHLNVGGFFKVTSGAAGPLVTDYQRIEDLVRKELPELDFIVHRGRGFGKLISDRGSTQAGISGVDIANEPRLRAVLDVYEGNLDELSQPNTIVLFEQQSKRLDVKVGDAITISATTGRGVANTLDCRVVALARDVGLLSSFNVIVSAESLRILYQLRPDVTGVIQVYVKPRFVEKLAPVAAHLREILEKAGYRLMEPDPRAFWFKFQAVSREDWTGQKLDVTSWEDELSFIMWTYRALQALSFILMVILIGIMVAGIMNTLWIAIRERTREIGTLRAIGMQKFGVARLFLLEASMLGVIGAVVGVALGAVVTWLINSANIHVPTSVQLFLMRDTLRLTIEPVTLVFAVIMITFVTGAAAIYPSIRAASRKPVDAMAHFG
ncbi:MAG TPA: FtsX-like permease family protein [Polyangiales bacterium]|nr:FtsX-like permease family protein [Polyangiales bacterium]